MKNIKVPCLLLGGSHLCSKIKSKKEKCTDNDLIIKSHFKIQILKENNNKIMYNHSWRLI